LPRGVSARRLILAIAVSIAVVLSAPFVGEIRSWLTARLGTRLASLVNVTVAVLAAALLVTTTIRIRERRRFRYALLAAAAGLAVLFGRGSSTSTAMTRAVERVHFFEYGLVTLLFCRAYRRGPTADPSPYLLAALSALLVGTAEEGVQWYVPDRIGELADVFLNLSAIVVGLLVTIAIDPPEAFTWRMPRLARARVAQLAALTVIVMAVFIRLAHLGGWVSDRDVRFRSQFTGETLAGLSASRAALWAQYPPAARPPAFSREDHYLTEALWHVQERNTQWNGGQPAVALGEERILERYFSAALRLGHEWPAAQREDAERRAGAASPAFTSRAERLPVWTWPRWAFWSAVTTLTTAILVAGMKKPSNRSAPLSKVPE
jgi:VanZ family protein